MNFIIHVCVHTYSTQTVGHWLTIFIAELQSDKAKVGSENGQM